MADTNLESHIETNSSEQQRETIHQKRYQLTQDHQARDSRETCSQQQPSHHRQAKLSYPRPLTLKERGLPYSINERGQMVPFHPRRQRPRGVLLQQIQLPKQPKINTQARHQHPSQQPIRRTSMALLSRQLNCKMQVSGNEISGFAPSRARGADPEISRDNRENCGEHKLRSVTPEEAKQLGLHPAPAPP